MMDERRPVVKRQLAVVGNKISVVVDHVGDEAYGFDDAENEPASFEQGRSIRPEFHLESIDEPSGSNFDVDDDEIENFNRIRKENVIANSSRPLSRNGLMRPSLSVEMAMAVSYRRGSAVTAQNFENNKESPFNSNLMRNSVSASHLPSLQNMSYGLHHQHGHQNGGDQSKYYPRFKPGGLSEPESMGGSCESLPDVCLTTPSGARRPLTAPYLSSIPFHLSAAKVGARGRSSSSGWTGGYSNFHKTNVSPPTTVHKGAGAGNGYATANVCGPSLGSLFGRQSSVRSSWAGEEFSLHNALSLDFLSSPMNFGSRGDQHLRHVKTEQLMSKHALKARLSKLQVLLDKAFALIGIESERTLSEGLSIVVEVMSNCWNEPKIGIDLAYGLCGYLREASYLDILLKLFINSECTGDLCTTVRLQTCKALEKCMSACNRDYILNEGYLEKLIPVAITLTDVDSVRVVVRLLETLFKHNPRTSLRLIELSALDYLLNACKSTSDTETFRHASLALSNLSMYSDNECQQKMISKNVPDWLFLLASSQDDVTRYYACLAICALVSNKEIEAAVIKSGTLTLVEPFLLSHKPSEFANGTYKHSGRPKEFLEKLVHMLTGKRREPRSLAAFHFAMDASIKEKQDRLDVLREILAVEALKQVAALPEEVAPKFAIQALEIIGEEVPHKLSQQVPLWTVEDVQYWINKIGFEDYAQSFASQKVDGDLLLLLTPQELERDIGMASGLLQKRFMRELDSLKMAADYSCVDVTRLDRFLLSIDPHFSVYTYKLLDIGVDCSTFTQLSEEMLKNDCKIENPIHRMKLCQWMEECKHGGDMEVTLLSKQIDIFISYRRSTGNQLASLLKVLLQLRGYKVFIDVDRLYAGQFDSSLLKNIQAAKHFILVLTPSSLDRCFGDEDCSDWVHKEVLCAMEHNKNVIPVLDPQFEWPDDLKLPADMRALTRFNGVHWVHEYQEACVDKLEKFIKGELNINRGLFPLAQRSKAGSLIGFRNTSKTSNGMSGSNSNMLVNYSDATELVLEALANHTRNSRGTSLEYLPPLNNNFICNGCENLQLADRDGICHHS